MLAVIVGAVQMVYHIIVLILFISQWHEEYRHYPLLNAFLYWVTMIFTVIITILLIFLRIRIDYLTNPYFEIEMLEIEEMRREQMQENGELTKKSSQKKNDDDELRRKEIEELKKLKAELAANGGAAGAGAAGAAGMSAYGSSMHQKSMRHGDGYSKSGHRSGYQGGKSGS